MDDDRMLCHACGAIWPKGNSLACPHCASEFTEIIEIPPDIPETPPPRPREIPRMNPWGDNSPWEQEDNGSGLGLFGDTSTPTYNNFRTYRSPDGRFSFSSASLDTRGPNGRRNTNPNPMVPLMMQSFDTILQNLMDPNERRQRGPRGLEDDPFLSSTDPDWLNDGHLTGHHPGLSPRNTDAAQPRNQPMAFPDLMNAALHAEMGATSGTRGPASALTMLSAILNMPHARNGDAVYSQDEFDRLISQFIENNGASGSAAPPATESAIRSLPKKKVDQEMLGTEGTTECSICMDNVELGIEVTVLPCTHWFHYDCIEAWLKQHNTCPHCRRSITANVAGGDGTCENPMVIHDSPEQPQSQPQSRRRLSSARTIRSGRSSLSSLQNRISPRLSPRRSPEPEAREAGARRPSRGEGSGSISSWFTNRFGSSA